MRKTTKRICGTAVHVEAEVTMPEYLRSHGLTLNFLRSAHTVYLMCFVWISEQTAIISLYSIN